MHYYWILEPIDLRRRAIHMRSTCRALLHAQAREIKVGERKALGWHAKGMRFCKLCGAAK